MLKQLLLAIVLGGLLAAGAWWKRDTHAPVQAFSLFALGTVVDLRLVAELSESELQTLQERLDRQLQEFQQRWSVLGDGALVELNEQLHAQGYAEMAPEVEPLLRRAQALCRQSQGLFDPAIGEWIKLWGFDAEDNLRSTPPSAAELSALPSASWCKAQWADGEVRLEQPGATVNLGGMAKGQAVAEIANTLREQGFQHFIVNAGGDLEVGGQHPVRPWRIGIRDPRAEDPRKAMASLELADGEALFSSGDYERYFVHAGERYHHLIDPRSGQPARLATSATVLDTDAALADAAATALFVAGPQDAADVAQALGVKQWMLVDAQGQVHGSEALLQRLQWMDDATAD
jgi:thiamine biosynthesis lipoprotein